MKKNKLVYFLYGTFALVGIIFVIVGVVLLISGMQFRKTAVEVTAVITKIDSYRDFDGEMNYDVYVDYSYDGNTYSKVRLNEYNSSMYEGKEISLFIDPDVPTRKTTNFGSIFGVVICIGIGSIFSLVGICSILVMRRKTVKNKELIAAGHSIFATVNSIEINTSYSVNRRHPFVIYCSYKDEYKDLVYRFKSDNLWTDPSLVIAPGSEIRVYVDGTDFSKYHVDAESILEGKVVDYT